MIMFIFYTSFHSQLRVKPHSSDAASDTDHVENN